MNIKLSQQVIGHQRATYFLSQAVKHDHIPQSILITGPNQIGKTTLATALATTINCQHSERPCLACLPCQKVLKQTHPDVYILDDSTKTLKIEQIRELQKYLALRPIESNHKIAIISNFERATPAAANALLKTLEEPSAHVILVLTAQNRSLLLPTIASRCQIIPLKPVAEALIYATLKEKGEADLTQIQLLSRLAMGRIGWAISVQSNAEPLSVRKRMLSDLIEILSHDSDFRLTYANAFLKDQRSIDELLGYWLTWWRDLLHLRVGVNTAIVNIDFEDKLTWFATHMALTQIKGALSETQLTLQNLNYNVNTRLSLEALLLSLPRLEMRLL